MLFRQGVQMLSEYPTNALSLSHNAVPEGVGKLLPVLRDKLDKLLARH